MNMDFRAIYNRRFTPDLEFRKKMWALLCREFFQAYIPEDSTVLEIGAGYCEFINNIHARRKIALDMNTDVQIYAEPGVETIISDSTRIEPLADNSLNIVFASNFFEHLTRADIVKTMREVNRVLIAQGKFIILQPNIRFCSKDYWMFFDHITPIDDRALVEVLELNHFQVLSNIPRFLPFTTKSSLPRSLFLIRIYLKLRLAWKIMGQQALIISCKKDPMNG
jgi:SAM-dependent methyltransferase